MTPRLFNEVGLIALVPDEWMWMWTTRHHVLSRLAQYFQVVWINPAHEWRQSISLPTTPLFHEVKLRTGDLTVYTPERWLPNFHRRTWVSRASFRRRLQRAHTCLTRNGCKRMILYIWRPDFADALDLISYNVSCYHIDDEYSFSAVDTPIDSYEAKLISAVDHVFINSPGLMEKKGSINPQTMFVPNGVNFEEYSRSYPEPEDLTKIPRPRIGYTGFIKRTLDWVLLQHLAKAHPNWQFIFVGAQGSETVEMRDAILQLQGNRNVHFLGAKDTYALAKYPQHFDVCMMPYDLNSHSAKYGYPLKLHEYLASGPPVIGSCLRSLKDFEKVVFLASSTEEWERAIELALEPVSQALERRLRGREVAKKHDWNCLVFRIVEAIAETLGEPFSNRLRLMASDTQFGMNAL